MITGFIFDLDGTLLDSETVWVDAYGELLRARGFPVSPAEALRVVYGKSYGDVYAETRRRFPMLTWTSEEMALHFRAAFRQLSAGRDVRILSSIELLKTLSRQFPVCVVSGSSREDVDAGIRLAGVAQLLRFSLAAEDYQPGKPNPAGFLLAAEKLALSPPRCLVFEDGSRRGCCQSGGHVVRCSRPTGTASTKTLGGRPRAGRPGRLFPFRLSTAE